MKHSDILDVAMIMKMSNGSKAEPVVAFKTVFLDRDGVINQKMPEGEYVCSPRDFHLRPGVAGAIARLNRADLRVVVATNQRGIARGLYTISDLEAIHAVLQTTLAEHGAHVDAFYFCPHDRQTCRCRKPLPGMFEQAQSDFPDIRGSTSVMIGDSLSDVEFGHAAGMKTILIAPAIPEREHDAKRAYQLADQIWGSLAEAVDAILARTPFSIDFQ